MTPSGIELDLPACSTVPQPIAPLRTPMSVEGTTKKALTRKSYQKKSHNLVIRKTH